MKKIYPFLSGLTALFLTLFTGRFIINAWSLQSDLLYKEILYPLIACAISGYFVGFCTGAFDEKKQIKTKTALFTVLVFIISAIIAGNLFVYQNYFMVQSEFSGFTLIASGGAWIVAMIISLMIFAITFFKGFKKGVGKNKKLIIALLILLFLIAPQPFLTTVEVRVDPAQDTYNIGDTVKFVVEIRNWQLIPQKISSQSLYYGASNQIDASIVFITHGSHRPFTMIKDEVWVWPFTSVALEKEVRLVASEPGMSKHHRNYYEEYELEMDPGENIIDAVFNNLVIRNQGTMIININEESSNWGSFYEAIEANDYDKVLEYIEAGEDVNQYTYYYGTPLFFAVGQVAHHYYDAMDIVELLIAKGADVNMFSDLKTPFMQVATACYFEDEKDIQTRIELGQFLIDNGADVNASNEYGKTMMTYMGQIDHTCPELYEFLIEHGVK